MPPEAPESHVAALPHHEDLWFEDGNIILGATNISFRLHRGILSRHSVVFRDMLMLPQGPETPKAFGCPLVQLHDKGEHLVMLFTVLYDGVKNTLFHPEHPTEFKTLRVLLSLAHKYEIQHVQDEALRRLRVRFPPTLAQWDDGTRRESAIRMQDHDVIAVVNLARSFDLTDVLPVALFECCQLPKELLIAKLYYGTDDFEQLSQSDLQLILSALDPLAKKARWIKNVLVDDEYAEDVELCSTRSDCKAALLDVAKISTTSDGFFHSNNPLLRTYELVEEEIKDSDLALCRYCLENYKFWHDHFRGNVWKDLGAQFGISRWPMFAG